MMDSGTDEPGDTPDRARAELDFDRLERYLAGDLSPSEHAAYTRALDADPAHRRIVEAIAAVYGRGPTAEPHWDVDAMRARAHFAMGAREDVASSVGEPTPSRRRWTTLHGSPLALRAR